MKKLIKVMSALVIIVLILVSSVACTEEEKSDKYTIEEDRTFYIEKDCTVAEFPAYLLLNLKKSTITLRTDGTLTMHFEITDAISLLLNNLGVVDLSMLNDFNVDEFVNMYAKPVLPGFDINDIPGSLALFEESIGMKITGLDFNDANVQALMKTLKKEAPLPEDFKIPEHLGVEYNGPYYMKNVHSDYSGDYVGVYAGKHDEDSDPFLIFTLSEEGQKIAFGIEVLNTWVTAVTPEYKALQEQNAK